MIFHKVAKGIYAIRYQLLASAFLSVLLVWMGGNPLVTGALAGFIIAVGDGLRLYYLRVLEKRITAIDGGPVWNVEMNHVHVGTISDAQYATIQRHCFMNPWLYVAQLMNLLRVISRVFDQIALTIPIGLFWIMVVVAIGSPSTISTMLGELHSISPEAIQSAVGKMVGVMAMMMLAGIPMLWMFGLSRFGFVNRFAEAEREALRKHCHVVAEGSIVMVQNIDDVHDIGINSINNDLDRVRPVKGE